MKNPLQRRARSTSQPASPTLSLLPHDLDKLVGKIIFPAGACPPSKATTIAVT